MSSPLLSTSLVLLSSNLRFAPGFQPCVQTTFQRNATMAEIQLPSNPTCEEAQRIAALPHEKLVDTVLSLGQQLLIQQRQIKELKRQLPLFFSSAARAVLMPAECHKDVLQDPGTMATDSRSFQTRSQLHSPCLIKATVNDMSSADDINDRLSYEPNVSTSNAFAILAEMDSCDYKKTTLSDR